MTKKLSVSEDLAVVKQKLENLTCIVNEIKEVIKPVQEVKNDVIWLKKFFWILATAVIGTTITALASFVIK